MCEVFFMRDKQPNFILYVTDQQRFDFLSNSGHPKLKTPNIDKLAENGVAFDRFYVANPTCMPNRASLMTCQMPSNHGVRFNGVPLDKNFVTFVDVLRSAGYDTALIGKSHLQTVTGSKPEFEPKKETPGYQPLPEAIATAKKSRLADNEYQIEGPEFWVKPNAKVPTPYYGFDHVDLVTRHGTNTGANHEIWLRNKDPDLLKKRLKENQLYHDYICPQAIRTALPEELYSSSYIAQKACEWLKDREGSDRPFFLMVSWPDPHHPFTPPGKYWDLYSPTEMETPASFSSDSWVPPTYVEIAQEERKADKELGQKGGKTIAVTKKEALEARALTCGMIALIDDCVGVIQETVENKFKSSEIVQIFTSDHGDHLGDHGLLFKGVEQYDTLTHVPFIWSDPKGPKNIRSKELAQTIDIGASILSRAKISAPYGFQGQPLSVVGGKERKNILIEYDSQRPSKFFGNQPRARTLITDQFRLTYYHPIEYFELFNLIEDPNELENLADLPEYGGVKTELIAQLLALEVKSRSNIPLPTHSA